MLPPTWSVAFTDALRCLHQSMNEASHQFLKDLDKKLWTAVDSRSATETAEGNRIANLDAAVYKHAVLGLIFLSRVVRDRLPRAARRASAEARVNCVSDSFALRQREIEAQLRDRKSEYFPRSRRLRGSDSLDYKDAVHQELEERDEVRWQIGVPPKENANFAWVQHLINQLDREENQYVV